MSLCPWATIINHGMVAINLNLLRSAFRACCRNIEQNGGLKHLGQIEYYFVSVLLFPFVGIVSDSCLHITTCTYRQRHLNPNHNYAFAQGNLHHSVTLLLLSRLPSLAGWAFLHHACSWSSVFVALTSPPSLLVNCFLFIISIFSSYPDLFLSLKYFFCHCTAQKFAFFCLYFSKEKNPFDFKR